MLDEKGKVTLKWWRHELHEHGERLSRICGDNGEEPETPKEVEEMLSHVLECHAACDHAAAILAACGCKQALLEIELHEKLDEK